MSALDNAVCARLGLIGGASDVEVRQRSVAGPNPTAGEAARKFHVNLEPIVRARGHAVENVDFEPFHQVARKALLPDPFVDSPKE
jgi:hypothetical protein